TRTARHVLLVRNAAVRREHRWGRSSSTSIAGFRTISQRRPSRRWYPTTPQRRRRAPLAKDEWLETSAGADDGIRTRDPHLGKVVQARTGCNPEAQTPCSQATCLLRGIGGYWAPCGTFAARRLT